VYGVRSLFLKHHHTKTLPPLGGVKAGDFGIGLRGHQWGERDICPGLTVLRILFIVGIIYNIM